MRILIADKLESSAVSELERFGCEVSVQPELGADDLPGAITGYRVLVVRSTKVTATTIEAADELALVVRAGAGVNTIDLNAAAEAGVYVANCPGKNADAVAELAMGLIIATDRGIANATADLRAGTWRKKHYGIASGLRDRRLGIIGYGSNGSALGSIALSFGMKVIAWSRSLTDERAAKDGIERAETLRDLAAVSDVVSVHLAAATETRGLLGAEFFNEMKEGSLFVNTSRGDIVDQSALSEAISARGLKVGLDVYASEPGSGTADFSDTALAELVSAATPHIGASTNQASEAIAAETVRVICTYKETGVPANAVNVNVSSAAPLVLIVRHKNTVGVLAGVLDELRRADINVEEMQNTIFTGSHAACCTLQLDSLPDDRTMDRIQASDSIYVARIETKNGGTVDA